MNACVPDRCDRHRTGFTLAELLVASTIALMVMGGVASLMAVFSRTATYSQAIVDMSSRMRSAASRLRQDLDGITAPLSPPMSPESGAGYFELIEGPIQDGLATTGSGTLISQSGTAIWASGTTSILGDIDDALLFTTRSLSRPFTGTFSGTNQVESTTAEVAWFCRPATTQPVQGLTLQTLYRRQLLVVGYAGVPPFYVSGSPTNNQISGSLPAAYNTYDISLRIDPTSSNALVPNTLADLSQRENRFFHGSILVPNTAWSIAFPSTTSGLTFDSASGREGQDVILANVIGFDVRVYDPDARPKLNGTTPVYPNEQDYAMMGTGAIASSGTYAAWFKGCFLDLGGNARTNLPTFARNVLVPDVVGASSSFAATTLLSGSAAPRSKLTATYDTWTTAYESNGVDDDADGIVDEGTNGVDNSSPADGTPDDPGEDETAPPYATPLKAIEIRIRCYDPTSREIRQVTVRQAFSS